MYQFCSHHHNVLFIDAGHDALVVMVALLVIALLQRIIQNQIMRNRGKFQTPQKISRRMIILLRGPLFSGDDFRTPFIWRTHISGNHHGRLPSTPSSSHHTNQSDARRLPQAFQCPYPPQCYRSCCPVIDTQSISSTSNHLIFTPIPGQKADDKCLQVTVERPRATRPTGLLLVVHL